MSEPSHPARSWKAATVRALCCLGLYLAGWIAVWSGFPAQGHWLFIAACVPGAWGLVRESWEDLRAFRLEIHFLMLAAAAAKLETVLTAWKLSRRATGIMKQNIAVALGMAAGMVLLSIIREVPLWLGVLTHEGSTAIVVLNSLRLLLGDGPDAMPSPATV